MYRSTTTKTLAFVLALAFLPSFARAQTPEDLAKARELFQEAYKDEQEKRFVEALEKFRRVAAVKESAAVRYRIGAVLEGMGRLREARDAFRALAAQKEQLRPEDQEIAASAAERAHDLDQRMPKLLLRSEKAPPDTRVTVDGAPVPLASAQPSPLELDPGPHVVASAAAGYKPAESTVTLEERREVVFPITMEKEAPPPPPPNRTLGYVATFGGAALFITGTALLIARESAIDDIERMCPNDICPSSTRSSVDDARDRASLFGPLGGVTAGVGLAAIGVGIYLLVRPAPAVAGFIPSLTITKRDASIGWSTSF